jgi:CheY-like chemotaxis protein
MMRAGWDVLLVEDNPADVYLVERAFEEARAGARLREARTSNEALLMLDGRAPDMMLLDLGLPGLSGLDLLALVRTSLPRGACHIVVMSSSNDEEDRRAALELGAERFITKPSTFEDLVAVVQDLVSLFRPKR